MSYQQITIVGRLGRDPEMRYTGSGVPVTGFSVATSRNWTDKDGNRQEKTVWFKVTCWRKLAEITAEHLAKGRQVMVVGEMEEPAIWTDREGNPRSNLEITARDVTFLGNKSDYEGIQDNAVKPSKAMHKDNASTAGPARDEIPY